jgi:transcriptional regulator with XRE-family HTH domain
MMVSMEGINMNKIKCLRSVRGISQADFGKLFNVDQTAVSNWEKGKNSIDIKILEKISEEFGVPMEFVYGKDFSITRPMSEWHASQVEDFKNAHPEAKDYLRFKYGRGTFNTNAENEKEPTDATGGELEENMIIYHRDGKTQKKKFTKEQMAIFMAMIDAIPDTPKDDI